MSEEEKKAIEKIRSFNQYNWEMNNLKEKEFAKPYFDALDTILNLIKKQSKEIEELKEDNQHQWEERCKLTFELENSTSNDKINSKIEEYEEILDSPIIKEDYKLEVQHIIRVLKELKGDN